MSWDCPYWIDEICQLNGITCKPGKGQCVLKGRYLIKSGKTDKQEVKDDNRKTQSSAENGR